MTMSHECKYVEGECEGCEREAAEQTERAFRAMRGRFMVVDEFGWAGRYTSRRGAHADARKMRDIGITAHVRRWRRRDVVYVGGGFEVTRSELKP